MVTVDPGAADSGNMLPIGRIRDCECVVGIAWDRINDDDHWPVVSLLGGTA